MAKHKRLDAMQVMLRRIDIDAFDVELYFKDFAVDMLRNIAISFSGGGYRALISG